MWIPVKHFLSVLLRALRRARHFALVEGSAIPTKGSLVIVSGQDSVRPMHLFGHTFDHDYYFELLREGGAGRPINYSMFYCTPSRCPGCPANRTFSTAHNPIPSAS